MLQENAFVSRILSDSGVVLIQNATITLIAGSWVTVQGTVPEFNATKNVTLYAPNFVWITDVEE